MVSSESARSLDDHLPLCGEGWSDSQTCGLIYPSSDNSTFILEDRLFFSVTSIFINNPSSAISLCILPNIEAISIQRIALHIP